MSINLRRLPNGIDTKLSVLLITASSTAGEGGYNINTMYDNINTKMTYIV